MRIAVITGASSGMGKEFTKQIPKLYKYLDEIWIISRNADRLQLLKEELAEVYGGFIRSYRLDITEHESLQVLKNELSAFNPNVRMLVNAAGMGKIGNISDLDASVQCEMVDINCKALTNMTKLCLPYISNGSRILNIASASAFSPQPGFAVYAATKSYVYSFSRALGAELSKQGVTVTAVCPGPVNTAFFEVAGEVKESKKMLMAKPEVVVKQALLDSKNKKPVSVYGLSMKASRIASSILPDKWLMEIMKRVNN